MSDKERKEAALAEGPDSSYIELLSAYQSLGSPEYLVGLDAAFRGFVDIMREDGHTNLTAEQILGMVNVVTLARVIDAVHDNAERRRVDKEMGGLC